MAQVVGGLAERAVSGVVQDDRSAGTYKCVEVKPLGYIPLAQVRLRILGILRDREYDASVEQWREKTVVEIVGDLGSSS